MSTSDNGGTQDHYNGWKDIQLMWVDVTGNEFEEMLNIETL